MRVYSGIFGRCICVWICALMVLAAVLFPVIHKYSCAVYAGEPEYIDIFCFDISMGNLYICEDGYRIGESTEIIPFHGVYKITGQTEEGYGIKILGGEHTVIFDNVDIDQRTLKRCYPLMVEKDSVLHLYLRGENALFAGSGYSAVTLDPGAWLDIEGFGQGSLVLLANPEKVGDGLSGTSAIGISDQAEVSYFSDRGSDDEMLMYAGTNRLSTFQVYSYDNEPYLKLQFDISHDCHLLSSPADCTKGQYCLECGREVAGNTAHIPGPEATCTQAQKCSVCGEVLKDALGHQGVWKAETVVIDGKICKRETMICTACGEVLTRISLDGE